MDRILFGDNQFFAVNHISDEKAMSQSIRFRNDESIVETLADAKSVGINTFMCTTHDRIWNVCGLMSGDRRFSDYTIYPCMPYAHKYANAITEIGLSGTFRKYIPGNMFGSMLKGGMAVLSRDYLSVMELLVDSEMKMFRGFNTPVIFLQNIITDLLLGLQMREVLLAFHKYIIKKYNAEPGYITMNFPFLLDTLEKSGIRNPIICTSINKAGFRMSGGKEIYEQVLAQRRARVIAMQVLAGGAVPVKESVEYVCSLRGVDAILFGASSKKNIDETVSLVNHYDRQYALSKAVS